MASVCVLSPWDHTDVNIKATVDSVKLEYLCYYRIKTV